MAAMGRHPSNMFLIMSISLLASPLLTLSQNPTGFISIDCGVEGKGYTDQTNGRNIWYDSDGKYATTGKPREVGSDFKNNSRIGDRYKNLRSFPDGTRNCYNLSVERGRKYLVRADFLYGNYDGLNQPPSFDLHLGVNLWRRVNTTLDPRPFWTEIVAVAPANSMSLCLVNRGSGVPFVSVIELRPLGNEMYPLANASQSLVLSEVRTNFGGTRDGGIGSRYVYRYVEDPYDRLWVAQDKNPAGWKNVSTSRDVNVDTGEANNFQPPPLIMKTAVETSDVSSSLEWSTAASGLDGETHLILHFAELRNPIQSTEMEVYLDGRRRGEAFSPRYLVSSELVLAPDQSGPQVIHNLSVRATTRSPLPPLLNALEVYVLRRHQASTTDGNEVEAIQSIKREYGIERNWQGDPCSPRALIWDGLNCTGGDAFSSPSIISLNLSSSNLSGPFPPSVENLINLRSLDLSGNSLSGNVPEFLARLPSLQILDLANNHFTGSLPEPLFKKLQDGTLSLRTEGNPSLCADADLCGSKTKKKSPVPVVVGITVPVLVISALLLVWAWRKRSKRRQRNQVNHTLDTPPNEEGGLIHLLRRRETESQQFTYREIEAMTNHFEREIGKGGFGPVYHGFLKDGTQVAVKMLAKVSSQGENEFKTEVLTLMRVHHRNLVSLLGYCDEKDNLALVYEYMAQGCLVDHIRGKARKTDGLTWETRCQIALEAAVGLEYLHYGCKPPIVHRDVKSANILLNDKWEAKIADFGLSKSFTNDGNSYISTNVAGTLGYLDPEYRLTGRSSEKSDVFSFGVVLLELISGKPPVIDNGEYHVHIIEWLSSLIESGDIDSIADPSFQEDYDKKSIWRAVEIAMSCTHLTSTRRATMNEVVMQLKEIAASVNSAYTYRYGESSFPDSSPTTFPVGLVTSFTSISSNVPTPR